MPSDVTEKMKLSRLNSFRNEKGLINTDTLKTSKGVRKHSEYLFFLTSLNTDEMYNILEKYRLGRLGGSVG